MAGKKQHFIPQALIRGFSSNGTQVYQYRKGKSKPIVSAIKNVAAERCFYGEEDCFTDVKITDYENSSSTLLHQLQSGKLPDNRHAIASFVYLHLIRTRNIRLSINNVAKQIQKDFAKSITPNRFIEELKIKLHNDPEYALESFRKKCAERGKIPTRNQELAFLNILRDNIDTFIEISDAETFVSKSITIFSELDINVAQNAQNKVIPEIIDKTTDHKNKLKGIINNLEWEIIQFAENIILGDSAVIAGESLKKFALPIEKAAKMKFIFMPITSTSVLLGKLDFTQKIQAKQFNHMSASISQEFFISSKKVSKKLSAAIGLNSGFETNFDIEKYRSNFKL